MIERHLIDIEHASEYIHYVLESGMSIAHAIVATKDFRTGKIVAYAPLGSCPDELNQLTVGHNYPRDGALAAVSLDVANMLAKGIGLVFVAESPMESPGDPVLDKSHSAYVRYGAEIYRYCTKRSQAPPRAVSIVKEVIIRSEAAYPPLFAAIVSGPLRLAGNAAESGMSLTSEEVRGMCVTPHCIVLGAYDQEGFLVWQPN